MTRESLDGLFYLATLANNRRMRKIRPSKHAKARAQRAKARITKRIANRRA